ncbi:hypothetical protein G6F59_016159 [Rhizopus arrhizus]|nr:hypothetical protein G6F59_016159 [Rhizopus arrhizus]
MQVQPVHYGRHIIAGACQDHAFAQVQLVDQRGQFGVVRRHAAPDQHTSQPGIAAVTHQGGPGAQQVGMVFEWVPTGHATDHRRILGQAPLRANACPGLGVGRITRQVIAVGDHHHPIAPVAFFRVAFRCVLRRADNGARHAARQQRAGTQNQAR